METSESIKEIAIALCKFQGEVEKIKKTEKNPFFKSSYANLSSILEIIREPLVKNELSYVQFPSGEYGLTTMLMHSSGEWMKCTYEMKPTKHDPQGQGAVITYQRRYTLGAILGLNIDEDDDGNKGSKPQPRKEPTIQDKHSKMLTEKIKAVNNCDTIKRLELLWKANESLHDDSEFKNAVNKQKETHENK